MKIMEIIQQKMERVLDLALKKAQSAEVYYNQFEEVPIIFEADKLKSINTKYTEGVGLRVIKEGKIGFSSSTDLSSPSSLIENALSSAKFGQEAKFKFPAHTEGEEVKIFDKKIEDLKFKDLIEKGGEVISLIKEAEPKLRCNLEIEKTKVRVKILNSAGLKAEYKKSLFSLYVVAILVQKEGLLEVIEGESSSLASIDSKRIINNILKKVRRAKRVTSISTQRLPVIFTPKAVTSLMLPLQRGINGKLVQKGSSPLSGRLGEEIFDKSVKVFDDGKADFAVNTSPFDDEGLPCQKTPLIVKGVLTNFIYDLQTAGMMKTKSTANGARTFSSLPSPSTSSLIIEGGEASFKEMIEDIDEGIIVDQVMGSSQSNLLAGEFSLNVDLGFKIERGEVTGRVKDVMVSGNIFQAFKNVILGRNAEWVWGRLKTPHFYFKELSISGKR